jgi:hypothetical protein
MRETVDTPSRPHRAGAATLLHTVAELFPVFTAEAWQPHKPLALGIDKALIATGILNPLATHVHPQAHVPGRACSRRLPA